MKGKTTDLGRMKVAKPIMQKYEKLITNEFKKHGDWIKSADKVMYRTFKFSFKLDKPKK